MADPQAPPGGFQQGGWYGGRQYWNGSFSQPGQIHTESNQQGAGELVSKEVNLQSDVVQGNQPGDIEKYLANLRVAQQPTTRSQVTPYLNNYQNSAFAADGAPATKIPTLNELKTELTPAGGRPELLNRAAEFERLRDERGVEGLEEQLNDLIAQEDEEVAFFRKQRFDERGKPVAMGVIEGRIGEEENAAQERLDAIGRQKSRINDQLKTAYSAINMYMQFMGLDYQDANDRYNEDFSANLKMYDIISGEKRAARSEFESDRAAASANLTTYINAVTAGNLDYNSLSSDQKTMITKLEVQAGMPIGFTSNLKMDPGANIVFQSTSKGVTQIGIRNADGSISVQSYGTKTDSTSDGEQMQQEMGAFLSGTTGDDGFTDGSTYTYGRQKWVDAGGDPDDYDQKFRVYRNPAYPDQYQLEDGD